MKKKLTIIDILVILAIVLVVVFGVFKYVFKPAEKVEKTKTITYVVLVDSIYPELAENIKPNKKILLDAKQNVYGKIIKVDVKPAENWFLNQYTEEYVHSLFDGRNDVEITIQAKAANKPYGYAIGEQRIRIGEVQYITTPTYSTFGHVVKIND